MSHIFENLAAPTVFEVTDFESIFNELLNEVYKAVPNYKPVESDPYHLILEAFAYRELYLKNDFNQRLKGLLLPYASDTNLDNIATHYGVERLTGEDDDAFRIRIVRSLDSHPTAGSRESYEYHAYSVHSSIDDVHAYSPAIGEITVVIASYEEGGLADDIKAQVESVLSDEKVRPITDKVTVREVKEKPISIHVKVSCPLQYRSQVEAEIRAKMNKNQTIGKTLSIFQLVRLFSVDEVTNVSLKAPTTETVCAPDERIVITDIQIDWEDA
ncbi:baseplate assembly protein [Marinomonas balearica]|uniref:Phage-related baseplate assembly protein n=1 Tax=Marinomonas balearica TaxID=491947 RepID=A0A4R6M7P6_9GAMM|nr:baseplate J/gp47 family protein [Marinomonas balearica]TDO97448.1 phage-related baseplate assembly protein [Marinomonas balearica]